MRLGVPRVLRLGPAPRRRVLLVDPATPDNFWGMRRTLEAVGARAMMPSPALATLIALTPPEVGVEYRWADENIAPAELSAPCDLVVLTGYSLHRPRLIGLAREARARAIPVALGGAWASLNPEPARELCDHLFVGEGEHTWPRFLRDWRAGRAEARYEQAEPIELRLSPPPDWSLVRGTDYLYFPVQASRGCPNRCDFCDAVRLVGRSYRTKDVEQVMVEVRRARAAGATTVFFSGDNFYVRAEYSRALLERLAEWNTGLDHPLSFACQSSVRIADDPAIVELLWHARFSVVFLGLESVRRACLEEVNKGQLFRDDLAARVRRLAAFGVLPFVGLIVGFDSDDRATFEEIERFLEEAACPLASVSILSAPPETPLYRRLSAAGRISEQPVGDWHASTNIVPRCLPLPELLARHRALVRRLYEPESFARRARAWLALQRGPSPRYRKRGVLRAMGPTAWLRSLRVAAHYALRAPGAERRLFWRLVDEARHRDPRLIKKAITVMTQYAHYRHWAEERMGAAEAAPQPGGDSGWAR